jgi:GNAT superfamily N-acetyltransferase
VVKPEPGDLTALARRVEDAQAEQMEATGRHAPVPAEALRVGGGRAVWYGRGSPHSSAVGVGLAGPVEGLDLDRVEQHLGRGVDPVRVELCAPADKTLAAWLGRRRYAVQGFQQVWTRLLAPPPPPPVAGRVRPMDPGEEDLWVDLFGEAFLGGPPSPEVRGGLLSMPRTPTNACFVAFAGAAPAGVAMASACGGVALLSGAGVVPAHRGLGLQLALTQARLAWALERGCDLAASAAEPGTASQRTLERAGFRCAYPKAVMVRQPPA